MHSPKPSVNERPVAAELLRRYLTKLSLGTMSGLFIGSVRRGTTKYTTIDDATGCYDTVVMGSTSNRIASAFRRY